MADLPSEIITSIYKHLDTPSSITALSSTCHKHHIIWKTNAASISRAVIYDNFPNFSLALELLENQEKVQGIDFTTAVPPTGRLQEIQQEARDAVSRYQTEGYRGVSLSNGDYTTTLVRNQALISIAEKAGRVGESYTQGFYPNANLSELNKGMSCESFISAFYRIWILATLRSGEAMKERVKSIESGELKHMMALVPSLVIDCSDSEMIHLGIGHGSLTSSMEYTMIKDGELVVIPRVKPKIVPSWATAMLVISEAHGGWAGRIMANELRGNPRGWHVHWLRVPDFGVVGNSWR